MIYVSKQEAALKSSFGRELKRQAPGFLNLQYSTNGAPDREVIGNGITTRWEFKHATPDFRSPGDQELMCCRLAAIAHCRYVVWYETEATKQTLIVHPRDVLGRKGKGWGIKAEAYCEGFDMKWLVAQVIGAHTK